MKRLLSLLALLLSAPVFAASDVVPTYPDLILQKNVTTVSTGSPQRTQPVAYQIVATGTGATVSATVKIYCKTINLHWASGTQQGSDITLSASNTDVDTSVTVTSGCPYMYSDVTAISATTVEVVATPIYASAGASTNANAGQYADDADFADGTSVGVLSQGVAESASPTAVTEGDVGAASITLNRAWKSSLYTPNGDSAMDDTADAVKVVATASESTSEVAYSTTTGPDGTGTKSILNSGLDIAGATYCTITILNTDDASNATLDELDIYLLTNDETVAESWPMYDETQFSSNPGGLEVAQSGTPAGARDAAPDTTLDESDTWKLVIRVAGYATLDIYASSSADDNAVDTDWTCN